MATDLAPLAHATLTIRDLPDAERPRERLEQVGSGALTTAELIALVLRTGSTGENAVRLGERLLAAHGGLGGLARLSLAELRQVKGLGAAKAAQLVGAFELGRRLALEAHGTRPQITSPADAARLLMPEMARLEQEHLRVVLLDTRNRVIAIHEVYKGSLNMSMIRVGEVFREAIRRNSAAVIVAHNHPSGDPAPSPEDVNVTRQLVEAGKLLDIEVLDHLVIGHAQFVSLKERGLGF
jgi:DNA repair protein RadC